MFLRWEDPDDGRVIEIDEDIDVRDVESSWTDTRPDFQLATVVAVFAELMRNNPYADEIDIRNLIDETDRIADDLDDPDVDKLADLMERAADLR